MWSLQLLECEALSHWGKAWNWQGCLKFGVWAAAVGWLAGYSLSIKKWTGLAHSSVSALRTKLWFGLLQWCCHCRCNYDTIVTGPFTCHWLLSFKETTLFIRAQKMVWDSGFRSEIRLWLGQERCVEISQEAWAHRDIQACVEQPLPPDLFLVCGWSLTCYPHSSLGYIDSALSAHLTLPVL